MENILWFLLLASVPTLILIPYLIRYFIYRNKQYMICEVEIDDNDDQEHCWRACKYSFGGWIILNKDGYGSYRTNHYRPVSSYLEETILTKSDAIQAINLNKKYSIKIKEQKIKNRKEYI